MALVCCFGGPTDASPYQRAIAAKGVYALPSSSQIPVHVSITCKPDCSVHLSPSLVYMLTHLAMGHLEVLSCQSFISLKGACSDHARAMGTHVLQRMG